MKHSFIVTINNGFAWILLNRNEFLHRYYLKSLKILVKISINSFDQRIKRFVSHSQLFIRLICLHSCFTHNKSLKWHSMRYVGEKKIWFFHINIHFNVAFSTLPTVFTLHIIDWCYTIYHFIHELLFFNAHCNLKYFFLHILTHKSSTIKAQHRSMSIN